MSRITSCFKSIKKQNKKAMIPYITAGYHDFNHTVNLFHILVKAGSDVLEVGVPFSDPVADGPVIEKAHHRAVERGVTLKNVLAMVAKFREQDDETPVVLMAYLNSIETMGYEKFARKASEARVDGVLVVDCPPEEAQPLISMLNSVNIDIIYLVSPNTSDERIRQLVKVASGFVYCVSLKGVTGASDRLEITNVQRRVEHLKKFTELPVCVGFGVRDGNTARVISKVSDGVIVGTVLVKTLEENDSKIAPAIIKQQIQEMRSAIDAS